MVGDISSDLGAAIQAGLGFGASANINPDRSAPSMFESVYGSPLDIAHLGIANPIAAIWFRAMMLEDIVEFDAAGRVTAAIYRTTARVVGVMPGNDKIEVIADAILSALD